MKLTVREQCKWKPNEQEQTQQPPQKQQQQQHIIAIQANIFFFYIDQNKIPEKQGSL